MAHPGFFQQPQKAQYTREQYVADLQNAVGWSRAARPLRAALSERPLLGPVLAARTPRRIVRRRLPGRQPARLRRAQAHVRGGSSTAITCTTTRCLPVAAAGLASDTQYQLIQAIPRCPRADRLPDRQLLRGEHDWSQRNWYATRHRSPEGRWRFHSDSAAQVLEGSQLRFTAGTTRFADLPAPAAEPNAEYRLLFADHVHQHFFNGGPLTADNAADLYQNRLSQVDRAVVGESASWGDNRRPGRPYTRNEEWVAERDRLLNTWFPQRSDVVFNQLRSDGLYPAVEAPRLNVHGGEVPRSFDVTLTAPAGRSTSPPTAATRVCRAGPSRLRPAGMTGDRSPSTTTRRSRPASSPAANGRP